MTITDELYKKYIGYYLINNQDKIYDLSRGSAQRNLDINSLKKLKVIIPPIDEQKQIVSHFDIWSDLIRSYYSNIEKIKEGMKGYLHSMLMAFPFEVKTLGDICKFKNGKTQLSKNALNEGKYKFFTCSIIKSFYLNSYDYADEGIIINSIKKLYNS